MGKTLEGSGTAVPLAQPRLPMPPLPVKLLNTDSRVPTRAHVGDAGLDLYSYDQVDIAPGENSKIHTGVAVAVPRGFVGLVFARSSLAKLNLTLSNSVGVIDSGYTGEVMVYLSNHSKSSVTINVGDRIAQMVLSPIITPAIQVVEELPTTARGTGGFGSTGV